MTAKRLMSAVEISKDRDRWLEIRRKGITASEVASLLGVEHEENGSPFALFVAKTTGGDIQGDTDAMMRGRYLEPYVAEKLQASHPELAIMDGGLYRSRERPWQMATFDRLAVDLDRFGIRRELSDTALVEMSAEMMSTAWPVQVKTAAVRRPGNDSAYWWGEPGTGAIPVNYKAQCLHEMDVADADVAVVPVLFMQEWRVCAYVIERNDDVQADIDVIRAEAELFLDRVKRDDPPPIDWAPATTRALKTLHPAVAEREAAIPRALAWRYKTAKRAMKRADRQLRQATNEILDRMGDAKYAVTPTRGDPASRFRVATRTRFPRKDTDVEELRRKYPHIAREMERSSDVTALYASEWARNWEKD